MFHNNNADIILQGGFGHGPCRFKLIGQNDACCDWLVKNGLSNKLKMALVMQGTLTASKSRFVDYPDVT